MDRYAESIDQAGIQAFMDGKKAIDNPWITTHSDINTSYWFAGWLDGQWTFMAKFTLPDHTTLRDVRTESVNPGSQNKTGRAIDVGRG